MSQTKPKRTRRLSITSATLSKRNRYIAHQRRRTLAVANNRFLSQNTSHSFSIPLLIDTMNTFHRTAQAMEEEIMLPLRLKDMPVEELALDGTTQPENWHEIYAFIQEMCSQLQSARPFAGDNEKVPSKEAERKLSNDDEDVILSHYDYNEFSSASSTTSSEEFKQSSSTSSVEPSYDNIKDELKYHYYGLCRSLDNLTSLANCVKEKYHEEFN